VRGRRYIFVCVSQGKNTEPGIAKNFRQEIYLCPHRKSSLRAGAMSLCDGEAGD